LIASTALAAKGGKGKPSPPDPSIDFVADMAFTAPYDKKNRVSPLALGMSSVPLVNQSSLQAFSKSFSPDGNWLVYHTNKLDDDGSNLHSVAISPVDDLSLSRQSVLFHTPDRMLDKTDNIFADVGNPLWLNLYGKNYLLISHSSDTRGKPHYLQLLPLISQDDPATGLENWQVTIFNEDGEQITKDTRYIPSECNKELLPLSCYPVKFNGEYYYASKVDYGVTDTGYALYIVGMQHDEPRAEILDRYKLFKIPILEGPILGTLQDITPSHMTLDKFNNHRVIGVTGSKVQADEIYFASYFYEQNREQLSISASSIWKADTANFDAANDITPITLIYDTASDSRAPDLFIELDVACSGVSLLLQNNEGEIKLMSLPDELSSAEPPNYLFDGRYPRWRNLIPCQHY
jgi:hypothetical protein